MYLSPAGHARGCVFTLAHSSPSPRPPTTTHTDSGVGLINRIYAAPVSALSPPLAGGDDLWTLWMTSGPFARPPVASWLYLLIPFSVCLHLLTGFNLPALALTHRSHPSRLYSAQTDCAYAGIPLTSTLTKEISSQPWHA